MGGSALATKARPSFGLHTDTRALCCKACNYGDRKRSFNRHLSPAIISDVYTRLLQTNACTFRRSNAVLLASMPYVLLLLLLRPPLGIFFYIPTMLGCGVVGRGEIRNGVIRTSDERAFTARTTVRNPCLCWPAPALWAPLQRACSIALLQRLNHKLSGYYGLEHCSVRDGKNVKFVSFGILCALVEHIHEFHEMRQQSKQPVSDEH